MLKIYHVFDYISIDDADWRMVGIYGWRESDDELESKLILDGLTFDEVREYLSRNYLDGVYNDQTLFRHKPIIRVNYSDAWEHVIYHHFDKLSYKRKFEEWKNVSLNWLMEHLSADQCIQYLKDRGMAVCPILK